MKQNFGMAAAFLMLSLLLFHVVFHPSDTGQWRPLHAAMDNSIAGQRPLLLVPLDSRPPCREFVVNGGKIIGRTIVTPPTAYMDYYSKPGETAEMRRWLAEHMENADAVILSVDQLLSGGLLAAREAHISANDIDTLATYLRTLHAAHPSVPLHAAAVLVSSS